MKKYILPVILFFAACGTGLAQTADGNDFAGKNMLIHHLDGSTTKVDASTIEYIDFEDAEPVEPAEPKVGDYFYSDGTWSDAGVGRSEARAHGRQDGDRHCMLR